MDEFGDESWELDALEPRVITDLVKSEVTALRDGEIYQTVCDREDREKEELQMLVDSYDEAITFLKGWNE